ncbi:MAG: glutamate--tRNA ligase, partial [Acidimicrobiaceae bacterium]|nr:glutamate--tRNA ligase [Acidimicrobiaceae bacterium]
MSSPRVRFAPAPTGFLHVGSARTALFNWLFARRHGGEMVLRVEDTDAALKTQEYVDAIIEPLRWLGLDWDSGPHFQSDRRDRHSEAVERLVDGGAAYYCDLTRSEIEERCAAAGYHGWSRDRDVADGPGVVVRFRCPDEGATVVNDLVRGEVSFPNESLEDFVIRRGDGSPTFHLANAVDDHDMGISHVIRGEDLLNTTPRVLLIWQALGYGAPPVYAHLPLLVNAKRQKLSKRRDDVSLDSYRRAGYLPEAMVNYLALLGWGPPDEVEIRPLHEIVTLFDLDAVKPAAAFFDPARLDHINSEYIKALTPEQFAERAEPFLTGADAPWAPERYDRDIVRSLAGEIQQRIAHLDEVAGWIDWIL